MAPPGSGARADVTINGSRVYPESLTSDVAGNLYNGSNNGTIYRALAGAKTAEPWIVPDAQNGLRSLFGVFADDAHGLLWACDNPNLFKRENGTSTLRAFDLKTGRLSAKYDFPTGEPAACNDIAIGKDGTVWASETTGGRIFVLRPHANELALYAKSADLVGIDGIAIAGDGKVYINNVRKQLFQRVERKADGSYDRLTTLTPSLVTREGQPWMVFGTPGGDQQDQWTLQFFLNVVDFGMSVQEALDAPTFHTQHFPSSFYPRAQHPGLVIVEGRIPEETREALRRRRRQRSSRSRPAASRAAAALADSRRASAHAGP